MFNAQPTGTVISRRWEEERKDEEEGNKKKKGEFGGRDISGKHYFKL